MSKPLIESMMSSNDLELVKRFIQHPENFMGHSGMLNAMQIANNPFGDYAPQSTQIQGILKGMYDAFTASLEKANAEEADQQKAFEALMATKKKGTWDLAADTGEGRIGRGRKNKETGGFPG